MSNPSTDVREAGATMSGTGWGRLLRLASGVLAFAALLLIAGEVAQVLGFPGGGARVRLELLSEVANGITGLLVVGAVVLGLAASRADESASAVDEAPGWPLVVAGVVGAVLVMAAIYSVIDILTIHIPSPGATGQQFQVGISSGDGGWQRASVILQRSAGGLLGAFAAWVVVTRQRLLAPRQQANALA